MLVRSEKLMTTDEVAAYLRLEPSTFLKKRDKLEKDTGFPPPLPGSRPLLWSPWGITAWELRNLPAELRELLVGAKAVVGADNVNVETLTARLQDMRKGLQG